MIESWVEMARRTQKMSFICNLGKGIGLRRERSDMLRDGGRGTVAALPMSSLCSDVTVAVPGTSLQRAQDGSCLRAKQEQDVRKLPAVAAVRNSVLCVLCSL